MYSGDEYYGDDITSGLIENEGNWIEDWEEDFEEEGEDNEILFDGDDC